MYKIRKEKCLTLRLKEGYIYIYIYTFVCLSLSLSLSISLCSLSPSSSSFSSFLPYSLSLYLSISLLIFHSHQNEKKKKIQSESDGILQTSIYLFLNKNIYLYPVNRVTLNSSILIPCWRHCSTEISFYKGRIAASNGAILGVKKLLLFINSIPFLCPLFTCSAQGVLLCPRLTFRLFVNSPLDSLNS